MTPTERDKVMFRLMAVFARPAMAPETVAVWNEYLDDMDFDRALAAVWLLERTKQRLPSLAEFLEAFETQRPPEKLQLHEGPLTDEERELGRAGIARVREMLGQVAKRMDSPPPSMPSRRPKANYEVSMSRRPSRVEPLVTPRPVIPYSQLYPNGKDGTAAVTRDDITFEETD